MKIPAISEAQLRQAISFLQNCQMTRDLRGHSRVPCYVLEKAGTKYFMKVYPSDRVDELKYIEAFYRLLQIPTAYIVEINYLPDFNQTYCIYEYIEGQTLDELLLAISSAEIEALGYRTGQELRKFTRVQGEPQKFQPAFDQELQALFDLTCRKKVEYNQRHTEQLPFINLDRLQKSTQKLKPVIYATNPTFIHSDINPSNVIIHDNVPYIIDTEGGQIKFRALDFRGNCWWVWSGDNIEQEKALYRGIYNGLFANHIPASFHQELGFTMIYQFLHRVHKYADDDEQIHYSFLRWHDNFDQTNYFEDYRFDWF